MKQEKGWWCDIFGRWAHQWCLPSTISLNTQGILGCHILWDCRGRGGRERNHELVHWVVYRKWRHCTILYISSQLAVQYSKVWKRNTECKSRLLLIVKPSNAKVSECLASSPYILHVIILPGFLPVTKCRLFCWDSRCLQHFLRWQETFLSWEHRQLGVSSRCCHTIMRGPTNTPAPLPGTSFLAPSSLMSTGDFWSLNRLPVWFLSLPFLLRTGK